MKSLWKTIKALKYCLQFAFGGLCYYIIECLYRALLNRGQTHWTMFVIGGLSFVAILLIDEKLKLPIIIKAILSGAVITLMEFLLGYYYIYIRHTPIWTYETADFMGVISFTWALLWCGLALLVLIGKRLITKLQNKMIDK